MINKQMFRLKKDGEPYARCFCKDFTKIENYSKAVLDTTQTWDCHHRRETHYLKNGIWIRRNEDLPKQQLIEDDVYYNVPPEELIFLTQAEHKTLHYKDKLINRKDLSKKVLCVETCKVFDSIIDVYRQTGINSSHISAVCLGHRKTAGGFHWKYYEEC